MKIIIDADGCPVVKKTIEIAKKYQIEVWVISDTAHEFNIPFINCLIVDAGKDAVDFEVIRHLKSGDLVVTQDYGLAAMVLTKRAHAISQNGLFYTNENIDELLFSRHLSQKMRQAKARVKGPRKRLKSDDQIYEKNLCDWLTQLVKIER